MSEPEISTFLPNYCMPKKSWPNLYSNFKTSLLGSTWAQKICTPLWPSYYDNPSTHKFATSIVLLSAYMHSSGQLLSPITRSNYQYSTITAAIRQYFPDFLDKYFPDFLYKYFPDFHTHKVFGKIWLSNLFFSIWVWKLSHRLFSYPFSLTA